MTFDMQKVIEDKKALRKRLAQLPIAEKLAILDSLRERTLTISKAGEKWRLSQERKDREQATSSYPESHPE